MWCRLVNVLSFIVIFNVCCADNDTTEDFRSGRNFDLDRFQDTHEETWRALNNRPQETEDWMLAKHPIDNEPMLKRRRPGRKRKRRPQNDARLPSSRSRPRRPPVLDSWQEEMLAEEPLRPVQTHTRRRQYPKYEEAVADDQSDEGRRRPYSKRISVIDQPTNENNSQLSMVDLKTLLKQSGGISLSELLQQRNLSLVDLLKGEQQAISALTGKQTKTNEDSISLDEPNEFSLENTTERRIFVPSHPKYYTSVDYRPKIKDLAIGKTTTDMPEKTSESISVVSSTVTFSTSRKNKFTLPPTNANLKNFVIKSVSTTEGPMRISVDLNQIINKSKLPDEKNDTINALRDEKGEKIKDLSARDEIMEILSDSVSRENLTRLLELRNMTLEELVEQRERGSSQRHLADIFHNKTKEPEPLEVTVHQFVQANENSFSNEMPVFDTFPKFNGQPIKSHYFPSVIELPSKTRESRENQLLDEDENNFINNPIFRSTTAKSNELIERFIPIWKQAYTDMQKKSFNDEIIITDELAEAVNNALNINDEENEFYRLPYGVRSAIIASAVIIGISLVVFLTIFIVFKWTQIRRKRQTYMNSFSSSKIKTPILETPYQRRTFGTIVNATLGRKKNVSTISCGEPRSLQEYLWNDRKQFN